MGSGGGIYSSDAGVSLVAGSTVNSNSAITATIGRQVLRHRRSGNVTVDASTVIGNLATAAAASAFGQAT